MSDTNQPPSLLENILALPPEQNAQRIRALLHLKGVPQSKLVRKYGIDSSLLSRVISGVRSNQEVRRAISTELGMPIEQLWRESQTP